MPWALVCVAAWMVLAGWGRGATIDTSVLQLTWSDEFTGTSLDTTHWQAPNGEVRQGTSRWMQNQVSVGGGALHLGVQKTSDPTLKYDCGAVRTRINYDPSRTLFAQQFGYFEARCKMPQNVGADYWAAFWLMAGNVSDSVSDTRQGTEIDVMESFTYNRPGVASSAFHWNGYGANHNAAGLSCGAQPQVLDGGFHTFGLWWDPNWYVIYIDGVEVGRTSMVGLGSSGPGLTLSQGTCLQPAYILLSCEAAPWAGQSGSGWDTAMPTQDQFQVDYVRVYAVPEPSSVLAMLAAGYLALRRPCPMRGRRVPMHRAG